MKLTGTMTFAGSPERVTAMLVNPGFAKEVGIEIGATHFLAEDVEHGQKSTYIVGTPAVARRLAGVDLTISETITWESTTDGRMTLVADGFPMKCDGPLTLAATDTGCVATYDAQFVVRVPLIGPKLEKAASGYLTRVIGAVQKVGQRWLAAHPA